MRMINKVSYAITILGFTVTAFLVFIFTAGFGGNGYRKAITWWNEKAVVEPTTRNYIIPK